MTGPAHEESPPESRGLRVRAGLAAFAAAFVADRGLAATASGDSVLSLSAAALAALLHATPRSHRAWLAAGALALQLAGRVPAFLPGDPAPLTGAALALIGTGAGILGCVLLDRVAARAARADAATADSVPSPDTSVAIPRDVPRIGVVVVPAIAAASGTATAVALQVGGGRAALGSLPALLAASLAGASIVIPCVLTHIPDATRAGPRESRITAGPRLVSAAALLVAVWLAVATAAPAALAPFGALVVLPLAWAAVRAGPAETTRLAALAALEIAVLHAFEKDTPVPAMLAAAILVGSTSLCAMALAGARREHGTGETSVTERCAFLERVVATSPATWFDWDLTTDRATYDDRWPALLGYGAEEIAPTTSAWEALVHPDDAVAGRAAWKACVEGASSFEWTGRFREKRGTWRMVLVRGVVVRDSGGRAVRIIGTHTDVSSAQALGDAERLAAARFRAAMAGSLDAFFLLDPVRSPAGRIEDFTVAHTNRLGAELLGRTEEEVVGRRLGELAPVLRLLGVIDRYGRALAAEEPLADDLTIESPQIRAQHLRQQAVPVGDALAVTLHDTTEHRRLQKELMQSQKMEGLGRLAGGVAHDFNNLLTVIRGYAEMAALQLADDDPTREHVNVITEAADRAADITGRLLTFARRSASETRRVDANEIVAELDPLLLRLIGEDVRLRIARAAEPAWIEIDPGSLEQVIVNLAANARDAMPGGGTLTIEVAGVEITQDASAALPESRPGHFVRIDVSDDGAGMSEEVLAHLFEPFFTTKTTGKGTGLGLATSYGVVKQADGFIHVTSSPGSGTRVSIHLPRAEEPQAQTAPIELDAKTLGGGETILVVEDEPAVRNFIAEALRTGGYDVLEAAGGNAAIEVSRARDGPIHALVSDVVMPDFRGPDLAAVLCAERTGLRVLYVSGYTAEAFEGLGSGDGGPALLRKPFTITGLLLMVRQVLDAGAARTAP